MDQYSIEEIQAKFEALPTEVREAITSPEVTNKIQTVAKKHNLRIDQTGELIDEVGLVMLGLEKSATFVDHIAKRLAITTSGSQLIATDINNEVFNSIKKHLQQIDRSGIDHEVDAGRDNVVPNHSERDISAIEQAGGFEIVKDNTPNGSGNNKTMEKIGHKEDHVESRETIMGTIEGTVDVGSFPDSLLSIKTGPAVPVGLGSYASPSKSVEIPPNTALQTKSPKMEQATPYTDPLVDHLLVNSVASNHEKIMRTDSEQGKTGNSPSIKPTPAPSQPGPDPYREPVI